VPPALTPAPPPPSLPPSLPTSQVDIGQEVGDRQPGTAEVVSEHALGEDGALDAEGAEGRPDGGRGGGREGGRGGREGGRGGREVLSPDQDLVAP
jgi:hypothetical protein